ncbi:hypothetical protein ACIF85_32390 [Streptomyces sp. NPDC086033]
MHPVTWTDGFWMDAHPVTVAELPEVREDHRLQHKGRRLVGR